MEKRTDAAVQRVVKAYRENGLNVSATGRAIGMSRQVVQFHLRDAEERGFIEPKERHDANVPKHEDYLEARDRKIAAFQKKKRKGNWRKPVMTSLSSDPYVLGVFGDPHLDSDACDYALFEESWLRMSIENRVFGVCVGDFFNNWLKSLAHLWREESTHPSDAWLLFESLMDQRGECLIAACSGNHDDWTHGPADPVDLLMKKYGVLYRKGAIRVGFHWDGLDPLFMAVRHKWRGHSMYSAAHGMVRANREGWRDALMIGGHIHQDEPRLVSHADGFRSHVCQVSAFKEFDDYADVHGFNGPRISPIWWLVIDPREPETEPDRIKIFWNFDKAMAYKSSIV